MYLSEQHTHSLEIINISFISRELRFISVCGDACKAFRELSRAEGLQSNTSSFHPCTMKSQVPTTKIKSNLMQTLRI